MGLHKWFSSSSYDRDKSVSIFSKWKDKDVAHKGSEFVPRNIKPEQEEETSGRQLTTADMPNLPNPKPNNYSIIRGKKVGKYLLIEIQYHDCTNYEGKKILLFNNCTLAALKKQRLIDPHFSENKKYHSPIARFEPTENGWNMAIQLAKQT